MAKVKSNKKHKEKHENKKESKDDINKPAGFFTVNIISYIILFAIFLFSFYIRGIIPIESTFGNGFVVFAADDAVFHMRLVENTIQFFPHRIVYDAFTLYPFGSSLFWGPLFNQTIAFFALIAGLIANGGMPSQATIDAIGAFFPAVMGALVVFPVYIIGKELIDNKAGLIGAFLISILPGAFLDRSLLGFTDHHIAEVFFLTFMMMFFIIAIKKSENITFDHWLKKDWNALKKPFIYSLLAGISFGAYLLIWTNGVFFAVVFGIFIIIQYTLDHFRGISTEYLGIVGIIGYIVAMIMVIPYFSVNNGFDSSRYSFLHLAVTGGSAVVFAFLSLASRELNKRKFGGVHYLLFLSGTILIGLIALKILLPALYDNTVGQISFLFWGRTGGGLLIGEAQPITYERAIGSFGYNYILSYIAIIVLCYYVIKKFNAEYTLMVIWSVFVLAIMLAQARFAYYYAINVAILSGVLGSIFLDFTDWKRFDSNDIIECLKKIRIQHVVSLVIVLAVIGFLPSSASPYGYTMYLAPRGSVSDGVYEWHDALTWMRYNTPEPDLPYYSIYETPAPGQPYNYSKNDYGVMSWWDYGHMITYWGHRIPNANPFQAGIGGGTSHAPGASTFLTAPTENEANVVIEKLGINGETGARYIISNARMAYAIQSIFAEWDAWYMEEKGFFSQVRTSQGQDVWPTLKFYNTIESRLHILDTNGLHNYRLVHESTPNPNTDGGYLEKKFRYIYNILTKENSLPVEDSGYAKVFEYVKGARITGSAPPNTSVTLNNTIKTNIGRTIQYKQVTSSNGTYEFIVPYSTLGPIPGETQFDTGPVGPYSVTAGNISKNVDVGEKDVLEGRTVTLNPV